MLTRVLDGSVAVVRIEHGKVNALDVALCEALTSELAELEAAPSVQAVVLTGSGSSFSAGVDLVQLVAGGAAYAQRFLPVMDRLFRTLLTFPTPIVAAVNGHAIAGGCVVATACDRVLMAEGRGQMGITELAVGVPFPMLALEIVRARVPERDFRTLLYGAETVSAAEALRMGLVDRTVASEALLEQAIEAARHLAAIPSTTFRLTKRAVVAPVLAQARAGMDIDADVTSAWATDEILDSVRAFLERRTKPSSAGNG